MKIKFLTYTSLLTKQTRLVEDLIQETEIRENYDPNTIIDLMDISENENTYTLYFSEVKVADVPKENIQVMLPEFAPQVSPEPPPRRCCGG